MTSRLTLHALISAALLASTALSAVAQQAPHRMAVQAFTNPGAFPPAPVVATPQVAAPQAAPVVPVAAVPNVAPNHGAAVQGLNNPTPVVPTGPVVNPFAAGTPAPVLANPFAVASPAPVVTDPFAAANMAAPQTAAPTPPAGTGMITPELAKAVMILNGFTDIGMTQMKGPALLAIARKGDAMFVVGVDLRNGTFLGAQPYTPPAAAPNAAATPQPQAAPITITTELAKAVMIANGYSDIGATQTRGNALLAVAMKDNALFVVGVDLTTGMFLGAQPFTGTNPGTAPPAAATPVAPQAVPNTAVNRAATPVNQRGVLPPPRRTSVATQPNRPTQFRPSFRNGRAAQVAAPSRPLGSKRPIGQVAFDPNAPIGFDPVLGPVFFDPINGPFVVDPVLGPIALDQPVMNAAFLVNNGLLDPGAIGWPVMPDPGMAIANQIGTNPNIIGGLSGPVMFDPTQGPVFIDPNNGLPIVFPPGVPDPNNPGQMISYPVPYVDPAQQQAMQQLVNSFNVAPDPNNPNPMTQAITNFANADPNQPRIVYGPPDAQQAALAADLQKRLAGLPPQQGFMAPTDQQALQQAAFNLGLTSDPNTPLLPAQQAAVQNAVNTFQGQTPQGLANTGVNQAVLANPNNVDPQGLANLVTNNPAAVDPNAALQVNFAHPIGADILNEVVQATPEVTNPQLVNQTQAQTPGAIDVKNFVQVAAANPNLVDANLLNQVIQANPQDANPDIINALATNQNGLIDANSLAFVAASHPGTIEINALNAAVQANPGGVNPDVLNAAAIQDPGLVGPASLVAVANAQGIRAVDPNALNQALQIYPGDANAADVAKLGLANPNLLSNDALAAIGAAQPGVANLDGITPGAPTDFLPFNAAAADMRVQGTRPIDAQQNATAAALAGTPPVATGPVDPNTPFMTFQTPTDPNAAMATTTTATPPADPNAPFMTFQTPPPDPNAPFATFQTPTMDPNAAAAATNTAATADPFATFPMQNPMAAMGMPGLDPNNLPPDFNVNMVPPTMLNTANFPMMPTANQQMTGFGTFPVPGMMNGFIDPNTGFVIDPNTGQPMPIADAQAFAQQMGGFIDPNTGTFIPNDAQQQLMQQQQFAQAPFAPNQSFPVDPNTGIPFDPNTGLPINQNAGVFVDPNAGNFGNPNGGFVDPNAGGFVDPNAGFVDPNAGFVDPNAGGFDPNAGGFDPNAGGFDPNAGGFDPNAGGFDPNAGGFDPNAGGGDPNAGF